jgi:hypothetical protein
LVWRGPGGSAISGARRELAVPGTTGAVTVEKLALIDPASAWAIERQITVALLAAW